MPSSAQVHVDDRTFQSALRQYMGFTSKTAVDALNGKMRDIMFMAAKNTQQLQGGVSAHARGIRSSGGVAAHRLLKQNKTRPFGADEWSKMYGSVMRAAKGYMKSCFAKAGYLFKPTTASTAAPPSNSFMKHKGTTVEAQFATEMLMRSSSKTMWNATNAPGDRDAKQAMVEKAVAQAKDIVYYDMVGYLNRKLSAQARANSGRP